ncbi:MAG: hypothetical protein R2856_29725 [Caldilineaceae bacterium]
MVYDELGRLQTTKFGDYRIYAADEVPAEIGVVLVQTYEPSGPYGAKAVAEIPPMYTAWPRPLPAPSSTPRARASARSRLRRSGCGGR